MNLKVLLVLPLLAIVAASVNPYTITGGACATPIATFYRLPTGTFHDNRPVIESILYHPGVFKKQLTRMSVQAVGYRQAGQPHFIIHIRKKELHGTWQSFYSNGQPCDSGVLYRNLPTGEWKTWYPNGQVKTVRTYSAEKYQYIKADLQRNHPKDQRYVITRLGSETAKRYFWPQYETSTHKLSLLQKIHHNTSGNNNSGYLSPFTACLHHGAFINYDESGKVRDSGQYVNGLQHGLWREWRADSGLHAVGFYKHGIRHGQWKYYDARNRLVYTERFKANGTRTDVHYFGK